MAEWLKAHAWKACLGETLTWVRIPLSPPDSLGCREVLRLRVENREKWPQFCNPLFSNPTGESVYSTLQRALRPFSPKGRRAVQFPRLPSGECNAMSIRRCSESDLTCERPRAPLETICRCPDRRNRPLSFTTCLSKPARGWGALVSNVGHSLKWIAACEMHPMACLDPRAFIVTCVVKLPTSRLLARNNLRAARHSPGMVVKRSWELLLVTIIGEQSETFSSGADFRPRNNQRRCGSTYRPP